MKRINKIIHHPLFVNQMDRLTDLESERIFCRHDLQHLLDVARLMWIEVLEYQILLDREVVYATALLHDIGRVNQIEQGIPHDQASAELAARILPEAGFTPVEADTIIRAICAHRTNESADTLSQVLYRADKFSRTCWCCGATNQCKWADEKKNEGIIR